MSHLTSNAPSFQSSTCTGLENTSKYVCVAMAKGKKHSKHTRTQFKILQSIISDLILSTGVLFTKRHIRWSVLRQIVIATRIRELFVQCQKLFKVLSFGLDAGPQSFCHSFVDKCVVRNQPRNPLFRCVVGLSKHLYVHRCWSRCSSSLFQARSCSQPMRGNGGIDSAP